MSVQFHNIFPRPEVFGNVKSMDYGQSRQFSETLGALGWGKRFKIFVVWSLSVMSHALFPCDL